MTNKQVGQPEIWAGPRSILKRRRRRAQKKGREYVIRHIVQREALVGTSNALNTPRFKFDYRERNEGRRFSECLHLTTAYLSTNLKAGGDVETSIWNIKLFKPAWPNPTVLTEESMKAMLQVEYRTCANRVEKIRVKPSTSYGLVLGQCTYYLRSRMESQDK